MVDVVVTLTSDEALVLSELLHRWEEAQAVTATIDDGERVTAVWSTGSRRTTASS